MNLVRFLAPRLADQHLLGGLAQLLHVFIRSRTLEHLRGEAGSAINDRQPSLLWKFSSGCQGAGGLKDFHKSGPSLVFELRGKTRIAGSKVRTAGDDNGGECCPNFYSVIRLAWNGRAFREAGMKFFPYHEP